MDTMDWKQITQANLAAFLDIFDTLWGEDRLSKFLRNYIFEDADDCGNADFTKYSNRLKLLNRHDNRIYHIKCIMYTALYKRNACEIVEIYNVVSHLPALLGCKSPCIVSEPDQVG